MVGKIIRSYEIESEIGSGGMGVVYRARSLTSGEIVAIKVIAPKALEDPERLRRFRHEAKIASTLNHPGIVKVHEIGEEVLDDQSRDFIVMELVEGRTLADRIGGRPMAVTEALGYAIQIAAGLSAAHAANVIHRDIKPSNLIINNFGIVKLADFGLAKITEQPADPFSETRSVNLDLTHDGTIMGSVAYMSPEQARGLPLDARSDIFSFGSVLYEMLSGRAAFGGDTIADKLSAVLTKEPPELVDIPSDLSVVLSRCLRKDVTRRWQSAVEVKSALEDIRSGGSNSTATTILRATSKRRVWLAAGVGLAAGLLPTVYFANRRKDPPNFQRLTFRSGDIDGARFAPGDFVAYTARWDGDASALFTCQAGNREGRKIDGVSGTLMGVTAANEAAVLVEGSNMLSIVSLGGSEPRPRLDHVGDACWSPDGTTMAVSRVARAGPYALEYPIGRVVFETASRPASNLRVSPSGRDLAFFEHDASAGDFQVSLIRDGTQHRVISSGWRVCAGLLWSPDGQEVWISAARNGEDPKIYSITLDGRERVLGQMPGWVHLEDIAADGKMLVARTDSRLSIRMQDGAGERMSSWLDSSNVWDICEERKLLVFVELGYGEGRNPSIFVRNLDGSPARRIGEGSRPSISPDGKSIVCIRRTIRKTDGTTELAILPNGPGDAALLATDTNDPVEYVEWASDSQRILVFSKSGTRLVTIQPTGVSPRIIAGVRATKASPDGKFAAGIENRKIIRYSLQADGGKPLTQALDGESLVRWSSRGILTMRPDGKRWIVDAIHPETGARTRLSDISPSDAGGRLMNPLVVSQSSNLYAYTVQQDSATLYLWRGFRS